MGLTIALRWSWPVKSRNWFVRVVRIIKALSTRIRIDFLLRPSLNPHGNQKRSFMKTVPRMGIFENAQLSFLSRRTKTEIFNTWSRTSYSTCPVRDIFIFPLFNFFVWTGENDWKTLSVGKYFLKTEKNLRFQKYPDPCRQGLSLRSHVSGYFWKRSIFRKIRVHT